jgi:hypothetical protein
MPTLALTSTTTYVPPPELGLLEANKSPRLEHKDADQIFEEKLALVKSWASKAQGDSYQLLDIDFDTLEKLRNQLCSEGINIR